MLNREAVERNLTPEHWNGHFSQDTCPTNILKFDPKVYKKACDIQLQMADRLEEQLKKYSLYGGSSSSLARFENGVFIPDQYPHGTLIRVSLEMLIFGRSNYREYKAGESFGFIVDASGLTKDGKNAVLYVANGNSVYGGDSDDIQIGAVTHDKTKFFWKNKDKGMIANVVERVNSVDIMLMGSGFKKKDKVIAEKRKPSVIFGIPESQEI
jgi:hypothetical protein